MNDKLQNQKNKLEEDIQLLELKQKKQACNKILNGGNFSKRTIVFCVGFTALFAIACLYVQYKTGYETYMLLRIVAAVFGGELLMLLFKRTWATDNNFINRFSKNNKNDETTISSISKPTESSASSSELSIEPSTLVSELESAVKEVNSSIDGGLG